MRCAMYLFEYFIWSFLTYSGYFTLRLGNASEVVLYIISTTLEKSVFPNAWKRYVFLFFLLFLKNYFSSSTIASHTDRTKQWHHATHKTACRRLKLFSLHTENAKYIANFSSVILQNISKNNRVTNYTDW